MGSREDRGPIVARGMAAAAIATFAVTVTHTTAAGVLPSSWAVVVAFVSAAVVCVSLAGRRLSWWRLSAAVTASQAVFHALLSVGFGATGGQIGHDAHHAMAAAAAASGVDASPPIVDQSPMVLAHVLAALVTVVAIGFGERAVIAVARWVSAPFRALRAVVAPPAWSAPALRGDVASCVLRAHVLSTVRRRGPPAPA